MCSILRVRGQLLAGEKDKTHHGHHYFFWLLRRWQKSAHMFEQLSQKILSPTLNALYSTVFLWKFDWPSVSPVIQL